MHRDEDSDQVIADNKSEDTGESTRWSDIKKDILHYWQEVFHPGQAHWDELLRNTRVLLLRKQSRTETVIACPLLPNSRNPLVAMAPPRPNCQKSALLIIVLQSDCAPSNRALVIPYKSSTDQNTPKHKASSDLNVPQHHNATFEGVKRFMETSVCTKKPWPILSNDKYFTVEEPWKLAIEAQGCQWALSGAPIGRSLVCQLLGGPSLIIDLQTRDTVSFQFCIIPLSALQILSTPDNIHSWNWRLVPFEDGWQIAHIKLLSIVTGFIWASILIFRSRLCSFCLMMLTSPRGSMMRNHGSSEWKYSI